LFLRILLAGAGGDVRVGLRGAATRRRETSAARIAGFARFARYDNVQVP
jgi:hypothetical protein